MFNILFLLFFGVSASNKTGSIAINIIDGMINDFRRIDNLKRDYIEGKLASYSEYLKKLSKISTQISKHIDFDAVVRDSLKYDYDPKTKRFRKDHFRGKSLTEKKRFTRKFKALIENITYPLVWDFFKDRKITHSVVKRTKREIQVETSIKYRKRSVEMLWVLHKKGARWLVYNIAVDGEYWIRSFRSQFNDIISKKSYRELVKIMDKKLQDTKEDAKTKLERDRKKFLEKQNKKGKKPNL